jgi:tRNA dimethylallyltransferase
MSTSLLFQGDSAVFAVGVAMAAGPPFVVILGPTASGKSALAMAVARQLGGEILTVDSMQVYRGMDIGTAKPTTAEQAEVPHHLLDVVDPWEEFTVARFVELADGVISDAARRGVPLIATGGTPLYYKALFEGLFEGPGADPDIRARLNATPAAELYERLKQVDPQAASRIHLNDQKRLVRALEVFELTGQPITSFQTHWTQPQARHRATWIGLDWDKDALNRRINARCKSMIADGWYEEVRRLLAAGRPLSKTAGEATGYRELIACARGEMSTDDAVEQIKIATRQLARRQMKWFRRFPGVSWLRGDQDPSALVGQAIQCIAATPQKP